MAVPFFKEIMVTYPNKSLKTSMVKLMVSAGKITISSLKMGAGKNLKKIPKIAERHYKREMAQNGNF